MLPELRRVIPAFLQRVDRPDRGVRWSDYLRDRARETGALARSVTQGFEYTPDDGSPDEVTLTEFDPDGEVKVVAAALYAASGASHARLLEAARAMTTADRIRVLRTYCGERGNRRHRPGRAFEHASYTFDVLSDYGAFRDLQRHRMLTLDWQLLTADHGYTFPEAVEQVGARRLEAGDGRLRGGGGSARAPVLAAGRAVRRRHGVPHPLLHADERPRGHARHRAPHHAAGASGLPPVCQRMHDLIGSQAGHVAVAEAMTFADHSAVELERLESERALDRKRARRKATSG